MKISDLIKRDTRIVVGRKQLFVAETDFEFNELPILKDSLVFNDGKFEIHVNHLGAGFLNPEVGLLLKELDIQGMTQTVTKHSPCDFELEKMRATDQLLWHTDHFDDDNPKRCRALLPASQTLRFLGIPFSSVKYNYNIQSNTLTYFFSQGPFRITINGRHFSLPANLEYGVTLDGRDQQVGALCFTDEVVTFKKFQIAGPLTIDDDGDLFGYVGEETAVEVLGVGRKWQVKLEQGFPLTFKYSGEVVTTLYNEKSHCNEEVRLRKAL